MWVKLFACWWLCAAVAVGGCAGREAMAPVASVADEVAADASADSPAGAAVAQAADAAPRVAEFTPPFPQRLELFEPPKRAQGTIRRDDHGETVELKGFVHVDRPRVVLSIDGVIAPIAEGDERYGVQVIAIHPPSAILQRGRNRWTATLE